MRYWTAFALVFCTLSLQACGNVPQPFRPVSNAPPQRLTMPGITGIGVLPPAGLDADTADYIAEVISADLQGREVLAEAVDRAGMLSLTLEGNLRETVQNDQITTITLDWRLLNRSGEIVERIEQDLRVNSRDWADKNIIAADQIAADMSGRLAAMFAPATRGTTQTASISQWADIAVSIQRPKNAPGDGAQALGRALANRLGAEGFTPATDTADFVLGAVVSVNQYDAAQDDITVVWQVLTPNEENLGEVRLDNRIPRGSLDGSWDFVAEAIVEAAFPGILEIIASAL